MPEPRSPISFMLDHIEECDGCSVGRYCTKGRELMDRAAEIAAEIYLPVPVGPAKGSA